MQRDERLAFLVGAFHEHRLDAPLDLDARRGRIDISQGQQPDCKQHMQTNQEQYHGNEASLQESAKCGFTCQRLPRLLPIDLQPAAAGY